jgi:ABC-type uncharacterized transport system auxiliary subunit
MSSFVRVAAPAAVALAALLGLSGCVRLNQPAPRIRDYTFAYPAPAPGAEALAAVLQIPPFAVSAAYDSHGMMYREASHRLSRYSYDRWAANPGNLVADVLARDFAEGGDFRAVQHARSPLASDYRLVGEVEAIEAIVDGDRCSANLELRILLVAVRSTGHDAVLLRRGYAEREPVDCGDGAALARGMSTALQRLSATLRADVIAAVAADLGN